LMIWLQVASIGFTLVPEMVNLNWLLFLIISCKFPQKCCARASCKIIQNLLFDPASNEVSETPSTIFTSK
jgi:hypothetical protein